LKKFKGCRNISSIRNIQKLSIEIWLIFQSKTA
jgi:hypothetical protein